MPLAQTITVFNKSGKVVNTSKHLKGVWKEAQSAYKERKADIKANRRADADDKAFRRRWPDSDTSERGRYHGRDTDSSASSSRSSSVQSRRIKRKPVLPPRPSAQRVTATDSRRSDRSNDRDLHRSHNDKPKLRFEDRLLEFENESSGRELMRRNTDGVLPQQHSPRAKSSRSASMTDIEMSLAYGEYHESRPVARTTEEDELRNQVSRLQQILDEANCLQFSVMAMIETLQKNPDQLAAVGLTLAEISSLASKMAPAALTSLKTASPAVFALLASPQFAIAAGVGIGVTVIAIGGYQIVKRIKQKKSDKLALDRENSDDEELQEIRSDLSRIEIWRRGIVESQIDGAATSVDGEFITAEASKQLIQQGKLKQSDLKSTKTGKSSKSSKAKLKEKGKADKKAKEKAEKKEKKEKDKFGKQKATSDDEESVFDKGRALIKNPSSVKNIFKRDVRRPESTLA